MTPSEDSREKFRAYMKAANSTSANPDDAHLNEALLIAYFRGEAPAAERDAAEAHLVGCEQCIALFRSVRDFLEPEGANDEEITATQTNAAWQSLLQHVSIELPKSAATPTRAQTEFLSRRDRKSFADSRVTLALAASLLIFFGVLGLLGWRLWQERQARQESQAAAAQLENKQRALEQRLSQLEQSGDQLKQEREQRLAAEAERDRLEALLASAQPNPGEPHLPVFTFRLSSERGAAEELQLKFPREAKAVKLRLFRSKPYEFTDYAIELVDQSGKVAREISKLRPARADGALTVLLSRGTLNAGQYKLRLFSQQGTTKQPLGEYGLSVLVER